MIGDSPSRAVLGAWNAGIKSLWVNCIGARWPDKYPAANLELTDLRRIPEPVDTLL